MKKIILILLPVFLLAGGPFDTPKERAFDLSVFNSNSRMDVLVISKKSHIKCRWVCDKKIHKEELISNAISFYKNSKDYRFKFN